MYFNITGYASLPTPSISSGALNLLDYLSNLASTRGSVMARIKNDKKPHPNRHRFETFRSKIARIRITPRKISAFSVIDQDVDQDDFSLFGNALNHWSNLNASSDFKEFRKEIDFKANSLASIIFYKDEIILLIEKFLSIENTQAYEPLIDLVVNLARDLGEEIKDDFHKLLATVLAPLKSEDPEVAEAVFTGIARLMKCVPRDCIRDPLDLFEITKKHLFSGPVYTRRLATEALGYIFRRKIKYNFKEFFFHIVNEGQSAIVRNEGNAEKITEVLSLLIFEVFKQANGGLSMPTIGRLSQIIDGLAEEDVQDDNSDPVAFLITRNLFTLLTQHSNFESFTSLVDLLLKRCGGVITTLIESSCRSDKDIFLLRSLLSFTQILISLCKDEKWFSSHFDELCGLIQPFILITEPDFINLRVFSSYLVSLLERSSDGDVDGFLSKMVVCMGGNDVSRRFFLSFFELANISGLYGKKSCILKSFFTFAKSLWPDEKNMCLLMLHSLDHDTGVKLKDMDSLLSQLLAHVGEISQDLIVEERDLRDLGIAIMTISILSRYLKVETDGFVNVCEMFISRIYDKILGSHNPNEDDCQHLNSESPMMLTLSCYLSKLLESLVHYCATVTPRVDHSALEKLIFEKMLPDFYDDKIFIRAAALYATSFGVSSLSSDILERCCSTLYFCARSFDRNMRIHSLQIISAMKNYGSGSIVDLCLNYEEICPLPTSITDKITLLNKIIALLEFSGTVDRCTQNVISCVGVAQMSVNLSPLWPVADRMLVKAGIAFPDAYWSAAEAIFLTCLMEYDGKNKRSRREGILNILGVDPGNTFASVPTYDMAREEVKVSKFYGMGLRARHVKTTYMSRLSSFATRKILADTHNMVLKVIIDGDDTRNLTRVDYKNCFCLLLRTSTQLPSITAEKSSFFSDIFIDSTKNPSSRHTIDKKRRRSRLEEHKGKIACECFVDFLKMFSVISPKNMRDKHMLFSCYMNTLTKGDEKLQEWALKCIFTYDLNISADIKNDLISLCNENQFKNVLMRLNVESQLKRYFPSNNVGDSTVIDILIHIIYGKLISKCERRSKSSTRSRMTCILAFVGSLDDYSIAMLFKLMFRPFEQIISPDIEAIPFKFDRDLLSKLPKTKYISGFITLLKNTISKLRKKLNTPSESIYKILLYILVSRKDAGKCDDDKKSIENRSFRCLVDLFRYRIDLCNDQLIAAYFEYYLGDVISKLSSTSKKSALKLLSIWSQHEDYVRYIFNFNTNTIERFSSILSDPDVTLGTAESILTILDTLSSLSSSSKTLLAHYTDIIMDGTEAFITNIVSRKRSLVLKSTDEILTLTLNVIRKLSDITQSSSSSSRAASAALSLIKHLNEDIGESMKTEIIKTVRDYLPSIDVFRIDPVSNYPSAEGYDYYKIISKIFRTAKSAEASKQLVEFFIGLAQIWKFLEPVSNLISLLNSQSSKSSDYRDYERIFSAYSTISEKYIEVLSPLQWLPIVYIAFRDMDCEEEFSIRANASHILMQIISRTSLLLKANHNSTNEYMDMVKDVIFTNICSSLKSNSEKSRVQGISLLEHLVLNIPNSDLWGDLIILLYDNDPEMNFFVNMRHLQIHRRARAVHRLEDICRRRPPPFCSHTASQILVPIILGSIKDIDRQNDVNINLLDQCLGGLSAICPLISRASYLAALKDMLNILKTRSSGERIAVKIISCMISGYFEDGLDTGEFSVKNKNKEVSYLSRKVLPKLSGIIYKNDDKTLVKRLDIIYPMVLIIRMLPVKRLGGAWGKLSEFFSRKLCSKDNEVRDSVRKSMVKAIKLLGPSCLPTLLDDMKGVLVDGYQLHVLSYTINYIISRTSPEFDANKLGCTQKLIEVCINEIFDDVSEEKDVARPRTKMVETGCTKGYETCEHLAITATADALNLFIDPIKKRMLEKHESKHSSKIAQYLRRLSGGISRNRVISCNSIIEFSSLMLCECLPFLKVKFSRESSITADITYTPDIGSVPKENLEVYQANAYHIADFSLALICSVLKKVSDNPESLSMDQIMERVVISFHSGAPSTISASAKVMDYLVKVNTPAIVRFIPLVVRRIFVIISRYSLEEPVVQTSLKLLATIICGDHAGEVSEVQVKSLVSLLNTELLIKNPSNHIFTFHHVRAIVRKWHNIPEVLELICKIMELSINSASRVIRSECIQTVVVFLCNPSTLPKSLERCILFYINNLNYKQDSGRVSALEVLDTIVERLNKEAFSEYFEIIVLSLVVVISNDQSCACIQMARETIRKMLVVSPPPKVSTVNTLLNKWITQSERADLQLASINLYTISAECVFDKTKALIPTIVGAACDLLNDLYSDKSQQKSSIFNWRFIAGILDMFNVILRPHMEIIVDNRAYDTLWNVVRHLCVHPHIDIKIKCLDIISNILEKIDVSSGKVKVGTATYGVPSALGSSSALDVFIDTILELIDAHHLEPAVSKKSSRVLSHLTNLRSYSGSGYDDLTLVISKIQEVIFRDEGDERALFLIDYIGMLLDKIPAEGIIGAIDAMAFALQKLDTEYTSTNREKSSQIYALLSDLSTKLQRKVGDDIYLSACRRARIGIEEKKQKRRALRAIKAVNNPEATSRMKIRRNLKKRAQKRKKLHTRKLLHSTLATRRAEVQI